MSKVLKMTISHVKLLTSITVYSFTNFPHFSPWHFISWHIIYLLVDDLPPPLGFPPHMRSGFVQFGLPRQILYPSRRHMRRGFNPRVGKIPWRRQRQPTPVLLPGKSHGQRSLAGYSPWGCKESDTTEHTCKLSLYSLSVAISWNSAWSIVATQKLPVGWIMNEKEQKTPKCWEWTSLKWWNEFQDALSDNSKGRTWYNVPHFKNFFTSSNFLPWVYYFYSGGKTALDC